MKYTFLFLMVLSFRVQAQSLELKIGDSLYVNGNYSKSIDAYKAIENQAKVYDKIAKAYMALGNYDKALLNYENSIEANPDNALFKLEYGKLLTRVKKHEKAIEVFQNLIQIDSLNPNYHYELGLSLEHQKDTMAIYKFRETVQLDTTHQKAIFKVARRHLVKRRYDSVNRYVDMGLKSYENNKELISLKAQNYYWQEDYHESSIWFEKLVNLNERTLFVYEKLRDVYKKNYNYEKAIEYGILALKLDPRSAENMYALGQLYEQQAILYKKEEYYKLAEQYIIQALLLFDAPLHNEYAALAGVYSIQKKYKESIETYKKAIRENPDDDFVHYKLALVKDKYYEDINARIKVFEDFIVAFPNSRIKDFAQRKITQLKEEKFLKAEESKD